MNELEWRRTLRGLQQPVTPAHDLWPAIATALDTPEEPAGTGRRTWLLAAVLAGAFLLAGGFAAGQHWRSGQGAARTTMAASAAANADPRLRGAFIELDATRSVLRDAMQQTPDSPLLQRLLARTERQQTQLRHLAHEAG
jgi:hypothetical protein